MATWYIKNGSDMELVPIAIVMARVTGSVGFSETYLNLDGTVDKFAEVSRNKLECGFLFLKSIPLYFLICQTRLISVMNIALVLVA